ncbi:MAG: CooT family nickel-binding protein [Candidatus Jordarchaeaceae archaeon]
MCEFKVTVSDGKKSSIVATDIIYAEQVEGKVILRDILGASSEVNSAIISYVNVNSQQLKLLSLPIIENFARFLQLYTKSVTDGKYNPEIEETWNQLKNEGNQLINNLKKASAF